MLSQEILLMVRRNLVWLFLTFLVRSTLNFFNVDLTRSRYLLLKAAKGIIKDNPDINYVYADINCSVGIKFKNGSDKYFNSLNELHSLL